MGEDYLKHRYATDGQAWASAGPASYFRSCDFRLAHRGDTVLESGTCSGGVHRVDASGATLELSNRRALLTSDTSGGGNVAIASSAVYRHDGSTWRLELDLAGTVATDGMLRAIAHEGSAGLLLGIGRSLFRTTAPLQVPSRVLTLASDIVSIAHDADTGTTLVGTSAATVHVIRSDMEQASFMVDGGVEEILVGASGSFFIRTRTSVYRWMSDAWSAVFVAAAGERVGDVAVDASDAFVVVVRDGAVAPCDRIRFVAL